MELIPNNFGLLKDGFYRLYKNKLHLIEAIFWNFFYFFPSRNMKVVGVTGTDGKTTTAFLIYQILRSAGKKVSLVATTGAFLEDKKIDTGLHTTTPQHQVLQKLISQAKRLGSEYLILEATSHGLDQHRLWGINFDIGILTNITHEHLDYHRSFDNYALAKANLFNQSRVALINKQYSGFIRFIRNRRLKVFFYSPYLLPTDLKKVVFSKFSQSYNRENAAAAVFACLNLGLKNNEIIDGVLNAKTPEGRLDFIANNKGLKIVVDFAHTPNALERVLEYLNTKKDNGRLIVVFGSAGERDRSKRPLMGRTASDLADIVILTAEDPRSESVADINLQIKSGMKEKDAELIEIENRGEAIYYALNKIAKRGDIVAICGKGHEKSLCVGDFEYSWSDKEAVLKSLLGKVPNYGKVLSEKL